MDWLRLYSEAIEAFRLRRAGSGGVAVAFNTNIDGIIDVNRDRLRGLFSANPSVADRALGRRESSPGRIEEPVDFVAGLIHHIERGSGGETMIHKRDTYDWVVSNLGIDEYRMGGNAGIMANALAKLGARFVIPHAVQLPERQARLFLDGDNIKLPVEEDGDVGFRRPSEVSREDLELVHLILEFKEGLSFTLGDQRIECPRNNRYIVNADDYNGKIVVDPAFVKGVEVMLGEIDKIIITGLHMLKREYPDGSTYVDRLREALGHVRHWRDENPRILAHYEFADIRDERIREEVLHRASRVTDSIGMNEDELAIAIGSEGIPEDPPSLLEAMLEFHSMYGWEKIVLHNRDFIASLVFEGYGVDPVAVRESQMVGVTCSQNRAYNGDFGDVDDLKRLVSSGAVAVSESGADFYEGLMSMGRPVNPGIWRMDGFSAVVTPCILSETTTNTVGLGDTLTAGTVLSEIRR